MPEKSRRRKGKYSPQSKKRKGRTTRPPVVVHQQAVSQTREAVPLSSASTSVKDIPAPVAKSAPVVKPVPVRHQYIAAELRTIGIIAGIILVILITLAFVPLPW